MADKGKRGGAAAAVAMTLAETAMANGVEPRVYLEWVLSNQRAASANPDGFLPWSPLVPDSIKLKRKNNGSLPVAVRKPPVFNMPILKKPINASAVNHFSIRKAQ